jgi:addiction module HigA family antidote
VPRTPIHPGEILADELAELGITPTELARQLRVPHNRISQILQGKRAITGDTALRLGHWFGTSAAFWMNLQSLYELRVAEQESGGEVARLPRRPDAPGGSASAPDPSPQPPPARGRGEGGSPSF